MIALVFGAGMFAGLVLSGVIARVELGRIKRRRFVGPTTTYALVTRVEQELAESREQTRMLFDALDQVATTHPKEVAGAVIDARDRSEAKS